MQQKGHGRRWNGLGLDTKSRSTEAKTGRKQPRLAQGRSKEKAQGEREWQIPERRQSRLGQRREVRTTQPQQRPIKNTQKGIPAEKSRQLRDIEIIPAENSGHSGDIGRRRDRGQRSRTWEKNSAPAGQRSNPFPSGQTRPKRTQPGSRKKIPDDECRWPRRIVQLKGYRQLREKQNQRDEETERRGQQWMW
jgi:hypothetical protein